MGSRGTLTFSTPISACRKTHCKSYDAFIGYFIPLFRRGHSTIDPSSTAICISANLSEKRVPEEKIFHTVKNVVVRFQKSSCTGSSRVDHTPSIYSFIRLRLSSLYPSWSSPDQGAGLGLPMSQQPIHSSPITTDDSLCVVRGLHLLCGS